jgi:hypothetical protein
MVLTLRDAPFLKYRIPFDTASFFYEKKGKNHVYTEGSLFGMDIRFSYKYFLTLMRSNSHISIILLSKK